MLCSSLQLLQLHVITSKHDAEHKCLPSGLTAYDLLHHGVIGSPASFWDCPFDVLGRVLDAACLAVQAVLCMYLKLLRPRCISCILIHTCMPGHKVKYGLCKMHTHKKLNLSIVGRVSPLQF